MKRALCLLCIALICVCASCSSHVNLKDVYRLMDYNESYMGAYFYKKYGAGSVNDFLYKNKKGISEEEYDSLCETLNIKFEKAILVEFSHTSDDINSHEIKIYPLVIEMKNEEEAQKALSNNSDTMEHFVQKEKLLLLNLYGVRKYFDEFVKITLYEQYSRPFFRSGYIIFNKEMDTIYQGSIDYGLYDFVNGFMLPEGIKKINCFAFGLSSDCMYCEKIIFNDSLIEIGDYAFYDNKHVKTYILNDNLKYIGDHCFANGSIEYIVIPESVETIGCCAFDTGMIFCEAAQKPELWDENFAIGNAKVYYAGEWEYEDGIPVLID